MANHNYSFLLYRDGLFFNKVSTLLFCYSDIGFTDDQQDKIVNKLLPHLQDQDSVKRENAVRTLGELGVNNDTVIMGVLPTLVDKEVSSSISCV